MAFFKISLAIVVFNIAFIAKSSADICGRTAQVVKELEKLTGKSCQSIEASDLALIQELNLFPITTPAKVLQEGDFAGLSSLHVLILDDNQLAALPEQLFAGLSSLQKLRLNGNQLTSLPDKLFDG